MSLYQISPLELSLIAVNKVADLAASIMRPKTERLRGPSLVLVAALVAGGVAHADDPASPPDADGAPASVEPQAEPTIPVEPDAPAAPREQATQLDDIVVTATKREKSVREIPTSMTVLEGAELERLGVQGIDDFIQKLPGVAMQDDGIIKRVTIRGIAAAGLTSNTTGVLLGDVPFNNPYVPRVTLDPNPFDLATVEVLKGPQGTLFGGSALNGAIRYVPQAPVFGEWQSKLFVQHEDVKEGDTGLIYGGALNIPIGETFALRAVGHDRSSAGWVDIDPRKDANVIDQTGGRLMARWQPFERWTVNAIAMRQRTLHDELSYSGTPGDKLRRKVARRRATCAPTTSSGPSASNTLSTASISW